MLNFHSSTKFIQCGFNQNEDSNHNNYETAIFQPKAKSNDNVIKAEIIGNKKDKDLKNRKTDKFRKT